MLKTFIIGVLTFIIPAALCSQDIENDVFKILDESINKNDKNLGHPSNITELENYLRIYPNSAQEDEILFRLAKANELKKEVPKQLYLLIKLSILHGESPLLPAAMKIIDSLFTYNAALAYSNENDLAIKELDNINKAENYQQAYVEFLSFIHFSNIKDFYPFYLDDIIKYKTLYKQPQNNLDAVTYWQAETCKRSGNTESAIIHFKTVVSLYASSEFRPAAMLELSRLYRAQDENQESAKYLIDLVNQFPENKLSGDAQFELAQLYENQFKDLQEAYRNYRMLVQAFPANSNYIPSLFKMSDIALALNNPYKAIESYKLIVETCKDAQQILKAYQGILKVQLEVLKDFKEAAHTHVLIAQSFPNIQEAPFHLLAAIKIYKTRLKMTEESHKLLEILISQYDDAPQTAEAKKLLGKN